ncbi:unconventional myosin heavy chain 6-like [Sycon ciliatum]|uniref:unconventional myosin heavy chain 6-like n=1 Tax=Sycon ciliatum TaxID=27933 RepID=UPI0031F70CBF
MAQVLERPRLAASGARPEDGVPDMTVISEIDEIGINTNLRTRYSKELIYTYTGTILVAVNPYQFFPIYEKDTIEKYVGKKMTGGVPHVFATAESAYTHLQSTARNQSCVISGESGAGKTETTKHILRYLCEVTSSEVQWVQQQIMEANIILEAFGNAKTIRNDNSSRFGKFIQVCFDKSNQINGCVIQDYLLEQSRITFQAKDERNYHIFYRLAAAGAAIPDVKKQFLLEPAQYYTYINQSGCYELEDVDDVKMFEMTKLAFNVLNITPEMCDGIFSVLSAILLVGNLEFKDVDGESCELTKKDRDTVSKIATLLGLGRDDVAKVVTTRQLTVRGQVTDIPHKLPEARDNRHAMAKALYSRTFAWLVHQINLSTRTDISKARFIGVLDIFGFENFGINSFEQLCINFTNEKLHKFFNHYVFALEQQIYREEEINFSHIQFTDNTACLELIEKAPTCVLRMLDDECRFPKGTDESYVEKQHADLGGHPNYVIPEDKRRLKMEFGIQHYAGAVMYSISHFLEKNKDVQQDMLFDYMRKSSMAFVKDICRFQDLLSATLELTKTIAVNKDKLNESSTQRRGKPTVGDTFKQQLMCLVDVLDTTTPWYVRCLKPNSVKKPKVYDDELIITQLRYSGMLDIIRIRREGFPVHVPASSFLDKYRCLAVNDTLPSDEKKAVAHILKSLKVPETEWQIGKTMVFLRNSVFDPLEERRLILLTTKIVLIQKVWRGYVQRQAFLKKKAAAVRIQSWYRGRRQRLWYIKQRRAAITLQSHLRGMFAREIYAALKEQKRKEEEERQRKLREQEEKRRLELLAMAERDREEARQKAVQASLESAQRELYSLAKIAESKVDKALGSGGTVDLDKMFTFLVEAPKEVAKEQDFLSDLNKELDGMFQSSQPKPEGGRTVRRKRRIEKKLLILQEEEEAAKKQTETVEDPAQFDMLTFAEKWFNNHPKDITGLGTFTMRRKKFSKQEALPKADMIRYTKSLSIPTSLIHLHDPENVNLACTIWKDLCKYMRGDLKPEQVNITIQNIIAYAIDRPELRDEVFCQLMRQVTENPREEDTDRGWHLLCLSCAAMTPGRSLNKFLQAFLKKHFEDEKRQRFARWCLGTICLTRVAPRKHPPSAMEISAVRNLNPLICRFYFLDGKAKAVGVDPSATASDVLRALAEKIELQSVDGWALYELNPEAEHYIKGHEYIADIIGQWERDKRTSANMSRYQTVSKKGHKEALGGGDSKFVFRKRIFRNPREIPQDPVEYHLMYAQAVHSVVQLDEFPVNEKVALQLAGLQLQVLWGDYEPGKDTRYNEPASHIPSRILEDKPRSTEMWSAALSEAHREFGTGKTEIQAKVWYLTSVKHYPLYGSTFFPVSYKGFWSYPNNLILSVDLSGFKFVNMRSKATMADFPWTRLESVSVDHEDPVVVLNMKVRNPEEQKCYMFETVQKEDIANLIASYSPSHSNWSRVGEAKTKTYHLSDEEKMKLYDEVLSARRALAENNLLQRPVDTSTGFLTTTLRRPSREKLMRLQKQKENLPFEKVFKQSFWSYSKNRLAQPISIIIGDELEDTGCKMFQSLLIYAGIEKAGGFEMESDEQHMGMAQMVISKCLEKEALCNEFYLQLIKQTTDQPDPNSRINIQNWRFMAMTCSIVVPRSKEILSYLMAHLRKCGTDSNTEEGKYAQFCMKCVQRTGQNRNRKYPPSSQEIMCVTNRRKIHARFYFMDGQFRALEFDSASTVEEVVAIVKERIGLQKAATGFSLFEVFGQLERNMLPSEKVADAIFKWEKYAKSTGSARSLKLTFKKRLFLKPFINAQDKVEFNLVFNQAIDDLANDRFPISYNEGVYVCALRSQVLLGPYTDRPRSDYSSVIDALLPKHMRQPMQPDDVARKHRELGDMGTAEASQTFFDFVRQWQMYGSTIFEVLQSYTATLPKNLWLAVNEQGIHIMKRRDKEPLVTYDYRNIVNYSPSLKNLMIVTESLTRGTKFVFNTSQASQIAHLIRDYTHIIVEKQRKAVAKRR